MTGVHLKFELDNTTAVAYINSMGSSESRLYDAVSRKIWAWCIPRDIWVSAVYIPGTINTVADRLSREHHSDHEWMLNRQIISELWVLYPGLSIDLYTTTLNAQLPRFASWRPDTRAAFVDAFSRSWNGKCFYAFPPFSLIQRCLDRVELDQAQGVLLVPAWPTQTCMVHSSSANVVRAALGEGVDCSERSSNPPVGSQNAQPAGSSQFDGMSCVRQFYRE